MAFVYGPRDADSKLVSLLEVGVADGSDDSVSFLESVWHPLVESWLFLNTS